MNGWISVCRLGTGFVFACWAIACDSSSGGAPRDGREPPGVDGSADSGHAGSSGASTGSAGKTAAGGATNGGSRGLDASTDATIADARSGASGHPGSSGADGGDAGLVWPCTPVNESSSSYKVGSKLSDDELFEAFASIQAAFRATPPSADRQAYAVAVRAAVQAAAHVGVTGIGRDCTVLVRLTDGTPISVLDETQSVRGSPPDDAGFEATDAGWVTPWQLPEGVTASLPDLALPGSAEVRIGDIEGFARHAIPHVKKAFEKRGYHVSVGMSSADLRTGVRELGVLWLSTHGLLECTDENGDDHFCIATDKLDPANKKKCVLSDAKACEQNAKDVEQSYLAAYFVGQQGTYYAINEAWVDKYWTFADHALVFIDGCDSAVPYANGKGLDAYVDAFAASVKAHKAGTYMGWSGTVNAELAENAADFFFDRVLGGNKDKVTPPQRPFSAQEVFPAMQARRLTNDPTPRKDKPETTATFLRMIKLDPNEPDLILAPSIQNLAIGDPSGPLGPRPNEQATGTQLFIEGEFGSDEGSVEVKGGASSTWDQRRVIATIDTTSSGAVVVKVPRPTSTIVSNAVPLTSWSGTMRVDHTYPITGGTFSNLDCTKLHLRADIHPFRLAPETRAIAGMLTAAGTIDPVVHIWNSVADTKCNGSIGGSVTGGTITPRMNQAIPWTDSVTTSNVKLPTWHFVILAEADTTLHRISLVPDYSLCTHVDFTGGKSTDEFCLAGGMVTPIAGQFDATWSSATVSGVFAAVNGDPCPASYTLTVEIPSAPATDTEG